MATDLTQFREEIRDDVRRTFKADWHDYRTTVYTDGSIEDKRKMVEIGMRALGFDADKKVDPLAGKTLVTVTFINGATQVSATPIDVEAVEVVEPKAPVVDQNRPIPGPAPVVDVDHMVGGLDALLEAMHDDA